MTLTIRQKVSYSVAILFSLSLLLGVCHVCLFSIWHGGAKNYFVKVTDTLVVERSLFSHGGKECFVNDRWYDVINVVSQDVQKICVVAYEDKLENHILKKIKLLIYNHPASHDITNRLIKLWQTPTLIPRPETFVSFLGICFLRQEFLYVHFYDHRSILISDHPPERHA